MDSIILLLLESSVALLLFYALYALWLRRQTFFKENRIYLLVTSLLSMAIPLFSLELPQVDSGRTRIVYVLETVNVTAQGYEKVFVETITAWQWVMIAYFIGVVFMAVLLFYNIYKLLKVVNKANKSESGKYDNNIRFLNSEVSHFTFLNNIYINPKGLSEREIEDIIAHEKQHISQHHTVDCLFYELLIILFWFNPIVYRYRKSARAIHEYLADEGAIKSGISEIEYQKLLFSQATGMKELIPAHSFNYSLTKKRLIMMTKIKSSNWTKVRLFGVLPVMFAVLLAFACNSAPVSDEIIFDENGYDANTNTYTQVDVMPEYPGGMNALRKYIMSEVTYPKEAKAAGLEGKVYVQFVVDVEGKVCEANCMAVKSPIREKNDIGEIVVVGYGDAKDENEPNVELLKIEALRVIEGMPVWRSGTKAGKAVRVAYTIPINFQLE